jgi:chorismate mutase
MTSALVRGLRGATTCDADTPEAIGERTRELILELMSRNEIEHDDVISVLFTTSVDLTSTFPASAAREVGFGDIPLMCASEINVPGSMSKCIRIMMHIYTTRTRSEIHHVYLHNAQSLRDDLPK